MKFLYRPVCVVAAIAFPLAVSGQDGVLTLESALERARERATAIVSAHFRVEEARARLRGATARRDNPVIDGAVGRRSGGSMPEDLDFGLSQTFELGGRRGGRIRAAEAAVAREAATLDDVRTRALREVALAFLRGLAAGERSRLAATAEAYGESVWRISERRHALGDVAILDVNLAASALSRARSEVRAAAATEALHKGEIRVLLALEAGSSLTLAGELQPRPVPELAELLDGASGRADIRSAEAELRQAEEEVGVGKGMQWPDVTPKVRYERDEGTNVFWGGLTLSLPLWSRGQEVRGVAEAQVSRVRAELEVLRRAAQVEIQSAYEAHRLRVEAVEALRETARHLEENATLARRSYDVGQLGLAELLLVLRETVEARRLHLERRLEAAEGEIELLARAGVLR
jgi:cobalt-zinc-cadmium efflux system outer membrane protein